MKVYKLFNYLRNKMTKLVIIADTHTFHKKVQLPKGDILIYAGDAEIRNDMELMFFINWFQSLDYKHIIWIGGNHDFYLEEMHQRNAIPKMPYNIHYLINTGITIEGIKFWGSPFSSQFGRWAFMGHLEDLKPIWNLIPSDTDIIITHSPPFGINDQCVNGVSVGCPALRDKLKEIKPSYHICGHIHEAYGVYQDEHTTYINASLLNEYYKMVNEPVVIDYE